MANSPNSLREQIAVFSRHRGKMFLFFVCTMVLVFAGIIFCPRTYESQAMLNVLIGRESVKLDPTATTGQTISVMDTRVHEINSVKDLLQSRALLEEVVEKLGPETILDPKKSEDNEESSGPSLVGVVYEWMLKINLADRTSKNEKAVRELASNLKVYSELESNVIHVAFRSETPEVAQKIVDTFLDAYHTQHSNAHRTQGSEDFFAKQSQQLAADLEKADQLLRDTKSKNGIVTVGNSQLALSKELELVELDLLTTTSSISFSQAKIDMLTQSLKQIPERLVTEEISESSYAADVMRRTLFDLQIKEKELSAKHTAEHPAVVAIHEQVVASQKLLDEEEKNRVHPTNSLNPANQQQKLALLAEQTLLSGYQAKLVALNTQLSKLQDKLVQLNEQEIVIAQLERQATLLREDYIAYSRSREVARIDQELDSQNISNVVVVQPPSFVERPVSPPKAIIVILGFAFATCGSFALALLFENLKESDSSEVAQEVSTALEAPVLGAIPKLQSAGVTTE